MKEVGLLLSVTLMSVTFLGMATTTPQASIHKAGMLFCDPTDPDDQSCLPPPDPCTQNPALCQ